MGDDTFRDKGAHGFTLVDGTPGSESAQGSTPMDESTHGSALIGNGTPTDKKIHPCGWQKMGKGAMAK